MTGDYENGRDFDDPEPTTTDPCAGCSGCHPCLRARPGADHGPDADDVSHRGYPAAWLGVVERWEDDDARGRDGRGASGQK